MGRSCNTDEYKYEIKEMKQTLKCFVQTVEDLKHKINEKDK